MDESSSESDEQESGEYDHYVAERKHFAIQARAEIAAEHYPLRDPSTLSRNEWEAVTEAINARFRELLIAKFPENHVKLNALYIHRKKNDTKPP